ncbi:hypothetical protein [Pseudooceanicola algae]|uniref:ApbE family protein n=1 Tax=Pseudooceanicola algae TaxID=1537215 RepID=A0A418SD33_9RHOB|nr:hypothetical protein [Pseudooceanicola algae]QPM92301.1 hypothetical protein PSAL_035650 [Pseudooceanicola algae]
MIEVFAAVAIMGLAAMGLGLGLMLGRGPALTSCSAAANGPGGRCADCPLRRRKDDEATR